MESMEKVSSREIQARICKFQSLLQGKGIDAAVLVQKVDVYYFSGTGQNAHLIIPAQGEPVLLIRRSLQRARAESPLEHIAGLASLKELVAYLSGYNTIGLELDVLPVNNFQRYQSLLPQAKFVDISADIRQLRMIKSDYELAQLGKAAAILDSVMLNVPKLLRPGISEVTLAAELEVAARVQGSQGYNRMRSFNQENTFGHLLSGVNGAYATYFDGPTGGLGTGPAFPQGASFSQIAPHSPVVVDFTLAYNGYTVDQTRIFSLGRLDDFFREPYERAREIQELIIAQAKPGCSTGELYELALSKAKQLGLEEYFMGAKPDQVGFIAHGVGLELDELPVLARGGKTILQPGMVLALEPKFVFPGRGAVGIENTLVVTDQGMERLTKSPEEIIEV